MCVSTAAFAGAGVVALNGSLPGTITYLAATSPVLLAPFKFLVAFTLLFHYGGGIRHLVSRAAHLAALPPWARTRMQRQPDSLSLAHVQMRAHTHTHTPHT